MPVNLVTEKSVPTQTRRTASLKKASAQSSKTPASKTGPSAAATATTKTTVPLHAKVNDMAFGHDAWYAASEEGLLVSHDHGLNWSIVSLAPVQPAAATSSATATSIRAIRTGNGDSYLWALTSRQLEVSGDGGKTWISRALPIESRGSLHLHAADENTVVLTSDHGVFVSRDAGESWHQANVSELTIDDLAPVRNAVVVSAANGSLFLSRDAGKTWGHMDGPADGSLSALRSREAGNQLIAASSTEGLFVLEMGSAASASANSSPSSPSGQK